MVPEKQKPERIEKQQKPEPRPERKSDSERIEEQRKPEPRPRK